MSTEKQIVQELAEAVHEFKDSMNTRMSEMEKASDGKASAHIEEKTDKISMKLGELEDMKAEIQALKQAAYTQVDTAEQEADLAKSEAYKNFSEYMRTGDKSFVRNNAVLNTASAGTGSAGGFLVPEPVVQDFSRLPEDVNSIRGLVKNVVGTNVPYEHIHTLSGTVIGHVGETTARADQATPVYKSIQFPYFTAYNMQPMTLQIMQDSSRDIVRELNDNAMIAFSEGIGQELINGAGGGLVPMGLLVYPSATTHIPGTNFVQVNTGVAAALGADGDDLVDLQASLSTRISANATWCMNRFTRSAVRKIKDAEGRSLWLSNLEVGLAPTLLDSPIVIDDAMPNIGAGAKPILYGDFNQSATFVDRNELYMLTDPYTQIHTVRNYVQMRYAFNITNDSAMAVLRVQV